MSQRGAPPKIALCNAWFAPAAPEPVARTPTLHRLRLHPAGLTAQSISRHHMARRLVCTHGAKPFRPGYMVTPTDGTELQARKGFAMAAGVIGLTHTSRVSLHGTAHQNSQSSFGRLRCQRMKNPSRHSRLCYRGVLSRERVALSKTLLPEI